MATEILMPRLGWTMEEGTFGAWLKEDGAAVKTGDLLFTVEGDKASQEVESFESGILRIPPTGPKPGDILPVGALLGYITQPGETLAFEQTAATSQQSTVSGQKVEISSQQLAAAGQQLTQATNHNPPSKIHISPRARRVAGELGVDWSQLTGSGATGRIIERDIRAAAAVPKAPESKLRVTPIAQRLAQEAGIDLAALAKAKGLDKIDRTDVEAAIAGAAPRRAEPVAAPAAVSQPGAQVEVPITRIRRLIAQRMSESAQTTAPVTLTTEADATNLVALREQLKASFGPRNLAVPSYNDLLIKLCGVALQEHPALNATWGENEIRLHQAIHIGLAVDLAEGLLVPVVRDVPAKSLRQIASESRQLIEKAQAHQISLDELQGGTFTITNLGIYNIDAFTPIINLPQCAILGVGRIVKKPAVYNDQVVPRHMVALSLTFDHRVVDGAPAARCLNTIRKYVEEPTLWLVG